MTNDNIDQRTSEHKFPDISLENNDEAGLEPRKKPVLWELRLPNYKIDPADYDSIVDTFIKKVESKDMFFLEATPVDYNSISKDDVNNLYLFKDNLQCKQLRIMYFNFLDKMKTIRKELTDLAEAYFIVKNKDRTEQGFRFLFLIEKYISFKTTELDRISRIKEKITKLIVDSENTWNGLRMTWAVANEKTI